MENKIDLDELERLAKAATRGPWTHSEQPSGWMHMVIAPERGQICRESMARDATFIAAANPAVILELIRMMREK